MRKKKKRVSNETDQVPIYKINGYSQIRIILCPLGALMVWLFNGFKGTFNEYLTKDNEHRNFLIGFISLGILIGLCAYLRTI